MSLQITRRSANAGRPSRWGVAEEGGVSNLMSIAISTGIRTAFHLSSLPDLGY